MQYTVLANCHASVVNRLQIVTVLIKLIKHKTVVDEIVVMKSA